MRDYSTYPLALVYDFRVTYGGIGDFLKYFMICLHHCIQSKVRLSLFDHGIELGTYIRLKYPEMYTREIYAHFVTPKDFYDDFHSHFCVPMQDVFYFTEEVLQHKERLFPISVYNSMHVRLGDKHLETDSEYVHVKEDERIFSEENMYTCVQENRDLPLFFCCDNDTYKKNFSKKYGVSIAYTDIGHTSLTNTTSKQVLDAVTEFYILTQSKRVFAASESGFSMMAAKFYDIPFIPLYTKDTDLQCVDSSKPN